MSGQSSTAGWGAIPTRPSPKVFISYSWSSQEYIDRVEELANDLHSHGVEVVFDQWDLEEGQDVHSFMEQAVNDGTCTHVLILCDLMYAEKDNGRKAGSERKRSPSRQPSTRT